MIKTLHITNAWHATSGGVATFYRALLDAANAEGRAVRLVVPAAAARVEPVGAHGRIYHVRAPRAPFAPDYRILYPHRYAFPGTAIARILKDEQPDLIEVCDKYSLQLVAGLLRVGWMPSLKPRPVTVGLSCERLDQNVATYLGPAPGGGRFARFVMRWLYFPFFDHHIAVSEHTASELRPASRGHRGRRGVWVSPMGVDATRFTPARRSATARQALVRRAALPDAATLLLYAGRLAPEKNLELLIAMMERLATDPDRDYRLLVAGSGSSESAFRAAAAARAPDRVRFLGHVGDRDELATICANADAFIHPNPGEPFGIAPLEAMASGLPLVAPDSGGVTTYAGGDNAWLSPPDAMRFADAVREIVADPVATAARVEVARQTAHHYRWERAAADYLRLYEEIFARTRGLAVEEQRAPRFYSTRGWLGIETRGGLRGAYAPD